MIYKFHRSMCDIPLLYEEFGTIHWVLQQAGRSEILPRLTKIQHLIYYSSTNFDVCLKIFCNFFKVQKFWKPLVFHSNPCKRMGVYHKPLYIYYLCTYIIECTYVATFTDPLDFFTTSCPIPEFSRFFIASSAPSRPPLFRNFFL